MAVQTTNNDIMRSSPDTDSKAVIIASNSTQQFQYQYEYTTRAHQNSLKTVLHSRRNQYKQTDKYSGYGTCHELNQ